jgi:molecular chaperone HscB
LILERSKAGPCFPAVFFASHMDFSQDYFTLLRLQPAFRLDMEALDQAYRALQTEFHPDRFVHAGDAEQRLAVQWSTRINEAYQTLKSPFARAKYLLELQGIHAMDANNTVMPAAFLMQQMEWREALMATVAASDYDGLQALENETKAEAGRLKLELAAELDERRDYPAAAETLRKYRFLEKFLADINNAYEEIE